MQGRSYDTAYAAFLYQGQATGYTQAMANAGIKFFDGSSETKITSIKDGANPPQIVTDGGTWSNGDVVTTETTAATGIVGSTDPANNTMTLSSSDESGTKRWIVNGGRKVTMDAKPAVKTTGYLEWSGTQVTGIVASDPGYKPVDPSLQLTFTDPSPTGESWDTDLPTGTTIKTRVLATNSIGTADTVSYTHLRAHETV